MNYHQIIGGLKVLSGLILGAWTLWCWTNDSIPRKHRRDHGPAPLAGQHMRGPR